MLKIPKQIYFDEQILALYNQYAQERGKSFAAVIREALERQTPKIKDELAAKAKKTTIMDYYGYFKSPYKKRYTAKQERAAFVKSMAENAAKEGL